MRLVARSHPHHQLLLAREVPSRTNHSILLPCLHLLCTSTSSTNCRKVAILAWVSPPEATTLLKLKHSSNSNSSHSKAVEAVTAGGWQMSAAGVDWGAPPTQPQAQQNPPGWQNAASEWRSKSSGRWKCWRMAKCATNSSRFACTRRWMVRSSESAAAQGRSVRGSSRRKRLVSEVTADSRMDDTEDSEGYERQLRNLAPVWAGLR